MTPSRRILFAVSLALVMAAGLPVASHAMAPAGRPVVRLAGPSVLGAPDGGEALPRALELGLQWPEPPAGLETGPIELWHTSAGEQQGSDLALQPVSLKLDAWPGGDPGARELGLVAADGLRLGDRGSKLARDTTYLATMGVVVIGVLIAMPESVSKWDTSNPAKFVGAMPANWSKHVSQGPVVDHDKWAINYIGHPISGSFYYQVARNDGFGIIGSTFYSALMSGLFWEFGIEAMAEVPSVQDLIVTPLGGALLGEAFYQVDQAIDRGGGTVLGSRVLGGISKFLLNPAGTIVDGIDATVAGSPESGEPYGTGVGVRSSLVAYPMSYPGRPELQGNYVGLHVFFDLP